MTTKCVLMLYGDNKHELVDISQEIVQQTKALELKYNFFSASSYLTCHINQRSSNYIEVDEQTAQILQQVHSISQLTDDIFDITVGTIKTHPNINDGNKAQYISKDNLDRAQRIKKYSSSMGLKSWCIKSANLFFQSDLTRFDLGGVIKEYAVDCAISVMKQKNINGMVNFGGDLRVLGCKPNGAPHVIGIKNPYNPDKICMNLPVINQALSTSGLYARSDQDKSLSYPHIISKKLKTLPLVSATVMHETSLVSGIISTSLIIKPGIQLPENCKVITIDYKGNIQAQRTL